MAKEIKYITKCNVYHYTDGTTRTEERTIGPDGTETNKRLTIAQDKAKRTTRAERKLLNSEHTTARHYIDDSVSATTKWFRYTPKRQDKKLTKVTTYVKTITG